MNGFDVNEYNQVHVYAVDLCNLPYQEQLHWKQYNEKSKWPISNRAIDVQILEVVGLQNSQNQFKKQDQLKVTSCMESVWSPKGGDWDNASKGLFYVNTENPNAWHDSSSH